MKDRVALRELGTHDVSDLNRFLAWLSKLDSRTDLAMPADRVKIAELAGKLITANQTSPHEYAQVVKQECMPYVCSLLPHLKDDPQKALSKVVAKRLFSGLCNPEQANEHIVTCTRSSTNMSMAVIDTLVKRGSRVVLTAPYFEPFPVMLELAGAKVIPHDTTPTNFKLTAADLRKTISDNKLGEGDWLFLTCPNNANMQPYSERELQEIAQVVAESGIRVIADELYARLGQEPHCSLASLSAWGPKGKVDMKDVVVTVSGCSKQFAFGSDDKRKLGAACLSNPKEARLVENMVGRLMNHVSDDQAVEYRTLIDKTPGQHRAESVKGAGKKQDELKGMIDRLNAKYAKDFDGKDPLKLHASKDGYLVCVEFSEEFCKKTGVKNSEDLHTYLFMTTRQYTRTLYSEGVDAPMVRLNVNNFADHASATEARFDAILSAVAKGKAPKMDTVNQAMNDAIRHCHSVGASMQSVAMR